MKYDCIVIGGGFYGCMLALELHQKFKKILILEKENDIVPLKKILINIMQSLKWVLKQTRRNFIKFLKK